MQRQNEHEMDGTLKVPSTDRLLYGTLSTTASEFRLLHLQPGSFDNAIVCQLVTRTLDDFPDYEAVSYAWDDQKQLTSIAVNSRCIKIAANVDALLRHVREADSVKMLWIDSLCIDQTNLEEKAQQIRLMQRIYRECSKVLVWLGCPTDHSVTDRQSRNSCGQEGPTLRRRLCQNILGRLLRSRDDSRSWKGATGNQHDNSKAPRSQTEPSVFAIIEHFAQDKHLSELPCFTRSLLLKRPLFRDTKRHAVMWQDFCNLLETAWHSRFWCVQEVLLPTDALFIYGRHCIHFDTIRSAFMNHKRHSSTCCYVAERLFPEKYYFCPDLVYGVDEAIGPGHEAWSLDLLFRTYRYKDCSDPRDKVYGILGLADVGGRLSKQLGIDYMLDVTEVYIRAMTITISQRPGDLRCFTGSGFCSSRPGLPSWVRDLQERPHVMQALVELWRLQVYDSYNACRNLTGDCTIIDSLSLATRGLRIDSLVHVGRQVEGPYEQMTWPYISKIFFSWRRAILAQGGKVSLLRPNVRTQSFWQTLCNDTLFEVTPGAIRRLRIDEYDGYETWLRHALRMWLCGRTPTMQARYTEAVMRAVHGRCLFITGKGHIGLCEPGARLGDELWILASARVPFILRPVSLQKDSCQRGQLQMVGDCYAHGFMDGEAVTECANTTPIRLI